MTKDASRFDVVGQLAALRRYARSLTRDDVDAEDLVHDTLLRAYERRATFRPGRNIRTWLMSILHNRFVDGMRGRRVEASRVAQAAELADPHERPGRTMPSGSPMCAAPSWRFPRSSGPRSTSSPSRASPTRRRRTRSAFRSAR